MCNKIIYEFITRMLLEGFISETCPHIQIILKKIFLNYLINFTNRCKRISIDILHVSSLSGNMGTFTTILLFLFLFAIIGVLLIISRKPQNR